MHPAYVLGSFRLEPEAELLLREGVPLGIGRRAVAVLRVLLESAGELVTKDQLLHQAWSGIAVEEANLTVQIAALRAALEAEPGGSRWIETLPRRGYRYIGPLERPAKAVEHPPRSGAGLLGEARLSIKVLPFAAGEGENGGRAIADALTEGITTGLSGVDPLHVVRRAGESARESARPDLDVETDFSLEGNVQRAGDGWRVSVRLVETGTHLQIWGVTHDVPPSDPLAGLDHIIRNIVATTQIKSLLRHGERVRQGLVNAGPSDHVAIGLLHFFEHTESGYAEAQSRAEQALALQPGHPAAQRLLSSILWHRANFGFVPIDDALVDRTFALAESALEANPTSEVYHWTMGLAFLLRKQHRRAAACMRRAQELNPHFALAYGSLGTVLAWAGESEESIRNARIAMQAHPSAPANFVRYFGLALAMYFAGDHDGAIENADKAISMRPSWYLPHLVLTAALAESGRLDAASAALRDLRRIKPSFDASVLATLPFTAAGLNRVAEALDKAASQ